MDVFVARQSIFDRNEAVVAYELLYRSSSKNVYDGIDGDQATADVILTSFLSIGIEKLAKQKKCFINFTENLIERRVPQLFSPQSIVVELLESVRPREELLLIIQELKSRGYTIALDDVILTEHLTAFLPYADIVKVDFLATTVEQRAAIQQAAARSGIKLLAEKVETRAMFEEAKRAGYDMFQGYFFSKPDVVASCDVPVYAHHYYQILNEVNGADPNIDKLTHYIEQDVSLTYRLLRLMNSVAFHTQTKVTSIKQALVLLGLNEVKKWLYVMLLKNRPQEGPSEAIAVSLTRAKLAEQIAVTMGLERKSPEFFLMGMFSLMETILKRPMVDILGEIPLVDVVKQALLGSHNEYGQVLQLAIALEKADWKEMMERGEQLKLDIHHLFACYHRAVQWSDDVMQSVDNEIQGTPSEA